MNEDLEFVRRFPDKCCATVTRGGELEPCDKVAVAVCAGVADEAEDDPSWWPVCAYHTRKGWMVPLADLLAAMAMTMV